MLVAAASRETSGENKVLTIIASGKWGYSSTGNPTGKRP